MAVVSAKPGQWVLCIRDAVDIKKDRILYRGKRYKVESVSLGHLMVQDERSMHTWWDMNGKFFCKPGPIGLVHMAV